MRIVNFVDGASSETTPTIGNIVASGLIDYVDDAAYEAAELGAPAIGNVYFNTTDDVIRYYDGTSWNTIQSTSEKDQANGYPGLDGAGKISQDAIPDSFVSFEGVWNATTNTPTLIDGTGNKGDVFRTSVAGTQDLGSGSQDFGIGDWVTYSGAIWERSDFTGGGNFWGDPVDADIIPDSANSRDLGSIALPFEFANIDRVFVTDSVGGAAGSLDLGNSILSINGFLIRTQADIPLTVQTSNDSGANADPTENVYLLTGNKTAGTGDSGDIIAQPGTSAGGSRGSLKYKDGTEGTIGHVLTSKGVDGETEWAASSMAADTENANLSLVSKGEISFDGSNLIFSDITFIQHPPFLDNRNSILAQSVALADGEVAYVDVNKSTDSPTVLTVNTVAVGSFVQTDNRLVIARRVELVNLVTIGSQSAVNTTAQLLLAADTFSWREQSFTTTGAGKLQKVRLKLFRDAAVTGTFDICIQADSAGDPDGVDLDCHTVTVTSLPTSAPGAFQDYEFFTNASLANATVYHYVFKATNLTGTGAIRVEYSSAGHAGTFQVSLDSGATWNGDVPSVDLNHEVLAHQSDGSVVTVDDKLSLQDGDSAELHEGISVTNIVASYELSSSSTSKTFGSGTVVTVIDFDVKVIDTHETVTGSGTGWLFTSPKQAIYKISISTPYETNVNFDDGEICKTEILKNGSFFRRLDTNDVYSATGRVDLRGSTLVELALGDTISIATAQNSGVSQTLEQSTGFTYVDIQEI